MRRFTVFVLLIAVFVFIGNTLAQDDLRYYQDDRISFEYSGQLAWGRESQWFATFTDMNTSTGAMPEYTEITLETSEGDTQQKVYVYPVMTFPTDPSQPFAQALTNLQEVLATRPATPDNLPMLPVVTAMPYFQTQVQYIDFVNGAGVRYLAAAGQDASPLSANDLFYTFQGLSSDGSYYIAAIFPVTTSILPDTVEDMSAEEYEQFMSTFDTYLADISTQLNNLTPQDFTPDLSFIDAAMTSIEVTPPEASYVTPADVESAPVVYNNITFTYAASLAYRVEADDIAPFIDTEGLSMYGSQPGYTRFSFINYPITVNRTSPQIYIYPVDTFPAVDTVLGEQLEEIKTFLADQNPLLSRLGVNGDTMIPTLPVRNAAQVLAAQPQRLDFQGGSGVRFVTTYAQNAYPVTNENLLYGFIGMTSDGRYVIAAWFPITASVLPDSIDDNTFDYNDFVDNFQTNMSQTLADLDSLDSQGYAPDLALLDLLVQSLVVGG
jgi:hypothetical protein